MSVIYNVIISCDGVVSRLFRICLCMVDSMKRPASVGLAQACSNNHGIYELLTHYCDSIHKHEYHNFYYPDSIISDSIIFTIAQP